MDDVLRTISPGDPAAGLDRFELSREVVHLTDPVDPDVPTSVPGDYMNVVLHQLPLLALDDDSSVTAG
jgi:hypothetical protein